MFVPSGVLQNWMSVVRQMRDCTNKTLTICSTSVIMIYIKKQPLKDKSAFLLLYAMFPDVFGYSYNIKVLQELLQLSVAWLWLLTLLQFSNCFCFEPYLLRSVTAFCLFFQTTVSFIWQERRKVKVLFTSSPSLQ